MSETKSSQLTTCLEDLSTELLMSIFDYLTSIEILVAFCNLNQRFSLIIYYYLQPGCRLTQLDLNHTGYSTYKLFLKDILPKFKSTITSFKVGSDYHYGQVDILNQFQLLRLDSLTVHLIDSKTIVDILQMFLAYNRLQWFDRINLIIDEHIRGWDEEMPFCVQNIPVQKLQITGKAPYVFAQHLMSGCYSITHLTIHLKFDHDLLPLLYYLPNLIECNVQVDDRGRDISNDLSLLEPLSCLKQFKYDGLMPSIHLRRLVLEINQHIQHLLIYTQDYQWPFYASDTFSSEFFGCLRDLQTFHFYIRLITSDSFGNPTTYFDKTKFLIERNFCQNIACVLSKDIGQIFSLPFAFDHFEIFEKTFFDEIQYADHEHSRFNYWHRVHHLTLHVNIYNPIFLKSIQETFVKLRSIDYQVPHFSLTPEDDELHEYHIRLNSVKKLIIRDSVKHGCHVPQPLFLLTLNLRELDIDHFYLMQILSMVSQQTHHRILATFAQLQRVTVRQFDERLLESFFSYFCQIKIFALIFTTYKMQIYRTKLPFLDDLLRSMPKLVSLKLEHVKKPHEYYAGIELQENVQDTIAKYYPKGTYWCKWYDDHRQKYHRCATFLFST
ncbi:unnamed protein product [Adineta ricciae]|uniref:F-box domain-containing protein n=1 Tax=Adineta ricciae TaxID=249248 RepID=A0A815GAP5_ADIRI|nr:unnamed protein product [Adineta ricciae]CAF1336850.1 unnamed protein product [Adineta ricciae]